MKLTLFSLLLKIAAIVLLLAPISIAAAPDDVFKAGVGICLASFGVFSGAPIKASVTVEPQSGPRSINKLGLQFVPEAGNPHLL